MSQRCNDAGDRVVENKQPLKPTRLQCGSAFGVFWPVRNLLLRLRAAVSNGAPLLNGMEIWMRGATGTHTVSVWPGALVDPDKESSGGARDVCWD